MVPPVRLITSAPPAVEMLPVIVPADILTASAAPVKVTEPLMVPVFSITEPLELIALRLMASVAPSVAIMLPALVIVASALSVVALMATAPVPDTCTVPFEVMLIVFEAASSEFSPIPSPPGTFTVPLISKPPTVLLVNCVAVTVVEITSALAVPATPMAAENIRA